MDKTSRVKQINDWILFGQRQGYKHFELVITPSRTYSNVCAPIAGIIEYYRSQGLTINVKCGKNDYIFHTRIWNPRSIEHCDESEKYYPFDKVWTFETSEGVSELVSAFILELRKSEILGDKVASSIEWCVNEVMDNVLQHAGTSKGYVMAQLHKQKKMFAFCVFDAGMGMYNSLKNTKHHPEKPIDAITLALQERVTRDVTVGQGNGLWGLSQIVAEANGQIEISSGGARYYLGNGNLRTTQDNGFLLTRKAGTTYLDVRINYDKSIDIGKALGGHVPADLWVENLEDDSGNYVLKISEISSGTGTRQSAMKVRTMALNIVSEQKRVVVLDFNGVNLISSSFADELVGKIISEKGLVFFMSAFKVKNLSETNAAILNRSVGQRMAQQYFEDVVASEFEDLDA